MSLWALWCGKFNLAALEGSKVGCEQYSFILNFAIPDLICKIPALTALSLLDILSFSLVCFAKIFSVIFSVWLIFFYCSETINKERKQNQCIRKDWISLLKTLRADLCSVVNAKKCSNASLSKFHSSDQRIKVYSLHRKLGFKKILY